MQIAPKTSKAKAPARPRGEGSAQLKDATKADEPATPAMSATETADASSAPASDASSASAPKPKNGHHKPRIQQDMSPASVDDPMMDCLHPEEILRSDDGVMGIIYAITNTETGLQYVGQTVSHRENHNAFRPFGIHRRLLDHISSAFTKTQKGSMVKTSIFANMIRELGRPKAEQVLAIRLLRYCLRNRMDIYEDLYIKHLNTIHPNGYNALPGGQRRRQDSVAIRAPAQVPSTYTPDMEQVHKRSEETRKKMSERGREYHEKFAEEAKQTFFANRDKRRDRKLADSLEFLKGKPVIDAEHPEKYLKLYTKGGKGTYSVILPGGKRVDFISQLETEEQSKERAISFLRELAKRQQEALDSEAGPSNRA